MERCRRRYCHSEGHKTEKKGFQFMIIKKEQVTQEFLAKPIIVVDIYCRVSTEDQENNTSLDSQEEECKRFCQENKLVVGMVHKESFTGFKYREREKLSLMRDRYLSGKIQGVVIRTLDRLSRSQVHNAILMEEMEHEEITLYCVKEKIDDTPMGKFTRMILSFVAEMEREKILDRTMTGIISKAKQGSANRGPKPFYGVKWNDLQKKDFLVPDDEPIEVRNRITAEYEEDETFTPAKVCDWITEEYDKGKGPHTLTRELNEKGIPGPEGGEWGRTAVYRILADRRRTGKDAQAFTTHNKDAKVKLEPVDLPDGTYPQIVNPETFERNQVRLAISKAEATRRCENPEDFLLRSGFVKCKMCGINMVTSSARKNGNGKPGNTVYQCRGRKCPGNTVASVKLDTMVWGHIVELAKEVELIERAIELSTNSQALRREISAIENSIATSQIMIEQHTKDLDKKDDKGNPKLEGGARDIVLELLNKETKNLKQKQEEKAIIETGAIDLERLAGEAEKILEWCKTVEEAREEMPYQRKRDFMRILGIKVFIDKSDKRKEELKWQITADLPEVSEILNAHRVSYLLG